MPFISIRSYSLKYCFRNNINQATRFVDKFRIEKIVTPTIAAKIKMIEFLTLTQTPNMSTTEIKNIKLRIVDCKMLFTFLLEIYFLMNHLQILYIQTKAKTMMTDKKIL